MAAKTKASERAELIKAMKSRARSRPANFFVRPRIAQLPAVLSPVLSSAEISPGYRYRRYREPRRIKLRSLASNATRASDFACTTRYAQATF